MKTTFLAVVFSLSVTSIFAQKENVVKVNMLSPVVKTGSFFFEHAFNENKSAQLGVGFTSYKTGDTKISGVFFTPEFRFYLSDGKNAPEGFYAAPFVRYQNLKIEDTYDKATLNTFGGGVVVGHQWIFKDVLSLDLFAGPSYNSGTVKYTSQQDNGSLEVPSTFNGFGVRTGITLGIAF